MESPEDAGSWWNDDYEKEAEAVLSDVGEESVSIMTIHQAKGLEFPVVFLPHSNFSNYRDGWSDLDAPVLTRRDSSEAAAYFGKKPLVTANYEGLAESESIDRAREEEKRLDYVASTRARDYLFFPVFQKLKQKEDEDKKDGFVGRILADYPGDIDDRNRETVAGAFAVPDQNVLSPVDLGFADQLDLDLLDEAVMSGPDVTVREKDQDDDEGETWNQKAMEDSIGASGRSLHVRGSRLSVDGNEEDPTLQNLFLPDERWEDHWKLAFEETLDGVEGGHLLPFPDPVGTERGDLLHDILEELPLEDPTDEQLCRTIARHLPEDEDMEGKEKEEAVRAILEITQYDPLAGVTGEQSRKEFPFHAPLNQLDLKGEIPASVDSEALLEGIVDLLCVSENGALQLLDYKTNGLTDGLDTNEKQKHATQMEAYRALTDTVLDRSVNKLTLFYLDGPVVVSRTL